MADGPEVRVQKMAENRASSLVACKDQALHERRGRPHREGKPYRVFNSLRQAWSKLSKEKPSGGLSRISVPLGLCSDELPAPSMEPPRHDRHSETRRIARESEWEAFSWMERSSATGMRWTLLFRGGKLPAVTGFAPRAALHSRSIRMLSRLRRRARKRADEKQNVSTFIK
jgi:hypothetical protein